MKKIIALMMVFMLMLSLVACGEEAIDSNSPNVTDITLVSKEANFTKILVPSDFGDFKFTEGTGVINGTGESIAITETFIADTEINEITQEDIMEVLKGSYTNVSIESFDNEATVAGVDAIYTIATGKGNTDGKEKTVHYIILYFNLEDQLCNQTIVLTYLNNQNTSLENNIKEIVESISLE